MRLIKKNAVEMSCEKLNEHQLGTVSDSVQVDVAPLCIPKSDW